MTLRARLTSFFVVTVAVPLAVAGVVVAFLVSREVDHRTTNLLRTAGRAVAVVQSERVARAVQEVQRAAPEVTRNLDKPRLNAHLDRIRRTSGLDFLVAAAPGGAVLGGAAGRSSFSVESARPTLAGISSPTPPPTIIRASVPLVIVGRERVTLHGGWFADRDYMTTLAQATGAAVTLVADGRTVASSGTPPALPRTLRPTFEVPGGRRGAMVSWAGPTGGLAVVVSREGNPAVLGLVALLLVLMSVLVVSALGYALARAVTRPLRHLTAGALAIADGNLDQRVEISGSDELSRVAAAFNTMSENLRTYVGELKGSRDELRRVLERLGATLGSTHDLDAMLGVTLESTAVTLRASAGAVFLLSEPRRLAPVAAWGFEPPPGSQVDFGEGIAGRVAASGIPTRLPSPWIHSPVPAAAEPPSGTAMAAPLMRNDELVGVLALYGRKGPDGFTDSDLATLTSFAGQASVAIENVMLREEAQWLSVTDSLTGAWNRRYLQAALDKEIERAQRYGHQVSAIMIDLDRFKRVNDTHGHQRGDSVLVELCRRVAASIRGQVDTLARYGGEEFVVVLPETSLAGAVVTARKLLEAVRGAPFTDEAGGQQLHLTASAGVASYPVDGPVGEDLLRAADQALYRAKGGGRDRVEVSAAAPQVTGAAG